MAGTVVVQNPRTGEILALANAPSFNPNLSREITPEKLKNHAVSDVYEPGSVFKTVDLLVALRGKAGAAGRDHQLRSRLHHGRRHPHSRFAPHRHGHAGEGLCRVERRGRGEDGAAPGAGALLQAHSGLRLRTAYEHRTAGRDARTGAQSQPLGRLFDRIDGDRAGGRSDAAAGGVDDVDDCQRRHLFAAAHRCRRHSARTRDTSASSFIPRHNAASSPPTPPPSCAG